VFAQPFQTLISLLYKQAELSSEKYDEMEVRMIDVNKLNIMESEVTQLENENRYL